MYTRAAPLSARCRCAGAAQAGKCPLRSQFPRRTALGTLSNTSGRKYCCGRGFRIPMLQQMETYPQAGALLRRTSPGAWDTGSVLYPAGALNGPHCVTISVVYRTLGHATRDVAHAVSRQRSDRRCDSSVHHRQLFNRCCFRRVRNSRPGHAPVQSRASQPD